MYFVEILEVIKRQWFVLLLGLLATAGLVYGAVRVIPPQNTFSASVVLLPPKLKAETGANPFLGLGGLGSMTDILARTMMSEDVVARVIALQGDPDYVVEKDVSSPGPLLSVTHSATSAKVASETVNIVLQEIPIQLARLQKQSKVKRSFFITSDIIAQDRTPTVERKQQTRGAVLAGSLGLALTLFLAMLIDSNMRRRRAARDKAAAISAGETGGDAPASGQPATPAADSIGSGITAGNDA